MGAASFVFIVALASPAFGQTKDIKLPGSDSNSPDTKVLWENHCRQICNEQSIPQIFSTGNSAIDGGIIGLGLGALGAAVLGPTLNQVVSRPFPGSKHYLSTPIYHRQCLHPRQAAVGGRDRQMGRKGRFLSLFAQLSFTFSGNYLKDNLIWC